MRSMHVHPGMHPGNLFYASLKIRGFLSGSILGDCAYCRVQASFWEGSSQRHIKSTKWWVCLGLLETWLSVSDTSPFVAMWRQLLKISLVLSCPVEGGVWHRNAYAHVHLKCAPRRQPWAPRLPNFSPGETASWQPPALLGESLCWWVGDAESRLLCSWLKCAVHV